MKMKCVKYAKNLQKIKFGGNIAPLEFRVFTLGFEFYLEWFYKFLKSPE